jgi:hypothetical protein
MVTIDREIPATDERTPSTRPTMDYDTVPRSEGMEGLNGAFLKKVLP